MTTFVIAFYQYNLSTLDTIHYFSFWHRTKLFVSSLVRREKSSGKSLIILKGRKIPCPSSDFAGRRTQKTFKFYLNKISFSLHVNSQSGLRFMWQPISSHSLKPAASYKKAPQTRKNPLIKKHDYYFWLLCNIIIISNVRYEILLLIQSILEWR